jgi:hypothetical protein
MDDIHIESTFGQFKRWNERELDVIEETRKTYKPEENLIMGIFIQAIRDVINRDRFSHTARAFLNINNVGFNYYCELLNVEPVIILNAFEKHIEHEIKERIKKRCNVPYAITSNRSSSKHAII